MHDETKRENLETIHLLEVKTLLSLLSLDTFHPFVQEKIHDLERKTELQSLKHEEILLEFESLKARRDRVLPPSSTTTSIMTNHHHHSNPMITAHPRPVPIMVDSQTSPVEDTTYSPLSTVNTATSAQPLPTATAPVPTMPVAPIAPSSSLSSSPTVKSSSIGKGLPQPANSIIDSQETKIKPPFNNLSAQIVVAKYSYEPLQCSPNDHPEVELPLNVGDYYLIYGDVDEVCNVHIRMD